MMKKIVINGRFLLHNITGVERYAREIVSELDKISRSGEIEMAVPPEIKNAPNYNNILVKRVGKLHNRFWEHISFPQYVKKNNAISLNLCNVAPLSAPGIVCIHDVKIKARPRDFKLFFLLWYNILLSNACRKATKIITVSEFSKEEICKYYHVDPTRIVVITNSWQHFDRISYDEDTLERYDLSKNDYYFSMCSLEPSKNFKWISEAAKKNPEHPFVVAGSINKTIFANGLKFEFPKNMKLIGYISDEEAKTLMRDCRAFLFPSFYEGFGTPPLEAISSGCRSIIVSDIAVMHEVLGECCNYISSNDYDLDLFCHESKGNSVLEKYSWKDSARKLYNLLLNV